MFRDRCSNSISTVSLRWENLLKGAVRVQTTRWLVSLRCTHNILGLACDPRPPHHPVRNCAREYRGICVAHLFAVLWHEATHSCCGDLGSFVFTIVAVGIPSPGILGVSWHADVAVVFVADFFRIPGRSFE